MTQVVSGADCGMACTGCEVAEGSGTGCQPYEMCPDHRHRMFRFQDGPSDIFVDFNTSTGCERAYCGCSKPFLVEMRPMSISGVPVSKGVEALTCPLCKWALTFDIR